MKLYKLFLISMLFLVSVGGVCATEPDNTTGDGGLNPVNPPITNTTDVVKIVNSVVGSELEKRDTIIQNQELRIKNLENSSADKDVRINELNNTVNNQSVIINSLKDDNKVLTDRVQALEYSKINQSNRIKSLEIDIKNLEESNKQLVDSNKQKDIDIKELNESNKVLSYKVDIQSEEISNLKLENENLVKKLFSLYEDLNNANKELLGKISNLELNNKKQLIEIQQLKDKIKDLTAEINTLKAINKELKDKQVSYGEVHNAIIKTSKYIKKHGENPDSVKCGKTTFNWDDFLNMNIIKDGAERVSKFKNKEGILPNYVIVAGYKLDKNIYRIFYNI